MGAGLRKHDLKCTEPHFASMWHGHKSFEIRKNDRNFLAGDILRLKEYDPVEDEYSGRVIICEVTHMLMGHVHTELGLDPEYVILSTKVLLKETVQQ